jgi:ParB family chromosome partitioning protein
LKDAGVDASRGTITYVDPEALTIITDKTHVLYDPRAEDPLDEALVLDIMERGVLQPIVCRDNGVSGGKLIVQVIAGRRRTRHLIEANTRRGKGTEAAKIPVTFVHGDDADMLLIAIAENAHRKNESVKSLAWKVRAVNKLGRSNEEIAKACGMSPKRIASLLRFLNLSAAAQKAIDSGEVPIGSIDALAEVPREEQEAVLVKLKENSATKNHEVKDVVKAQQNGHDYTPPERKKTWGRRELKLLKEELEFYDKRGKEVQVAIGLIDFIMNGDTKALADFDVLKLAITSVKRKLSRQLSKEEARS